MDTATIAIGLVLNQASSVLANHKMTNNLENFKEELHLLVGNLKIVQAFLLDAKSKNLETEAVKGWLQIVEAIATDADDLLEEYAYEVLRKDIEVSEEVDSTVSPQVFSSIVSGIVDRIKEVNLNLERICQESLKIGLIRLIKNVSEEHEGDYVYEREILGREDDVMRLRDMLINTDDQKDFSVVSIVGIAGQGKTTVARLVYENPVVVNHFDHRVWVSLAEDFDVVRIFQEIVESITVIDFNIVKRKSKEAIMRDLQIVLRCSRYLIVCDDVSDANRSIWESVEKDFLEISSSRGSKMMVLTRSHEVADIMNASLYYRLAGLANEDSWKLFRKRVLGRGRKETAELIDTCKRMVEKCRGVPLAIELISALMYSRKDEDQWSRVSAKWVSASHADVVLEAIRLTFDNLSSVSLKQCFMYCSVLPKNCLMERENMIQIWMAQGLLNSSSNEHTLEDTGELYFNLLLQASLLGEPVYDEFGNVKACKMHGLVHDFALHISRDYCSNLKLRYASDDTEVEVVDQSVNYGVKFQSLRALYLVGETFGNTVIRKMRRLHVLILDGINIKELPSSIGELKYLRYLDVSRTSIDMFPDSIMKLYNLQTLRVGEVKVLPEKFTILKNLRHIYGKLYIPRIGELVNLQTMPSFIGNGKEVLEGLKRHSNLRVLRIARFNDYSFPSWMTSNNHMHLHNLVQIQLEDCQCVEIPALGHLPNLQLIEISWMLNVKCIGHEVYGLNEVGSTTTVFPSLRKFTLVLPNLEKWLGVSNSSVSSPRIAFPRLHDLILDHCRNLTDMPQIDCLNSLSRLTISNCVMLSSLPHWFEGLVSIQEFSLVATSLNQLPEMNNLVSLQRMSIRYCESLVHFPDLSCLTSLQELIINGCVNLASISRVPCSLKSLEISYCFKLMALPELSNVSALRKLKICDCNYIVSIPNVPNGLRSLEITCCYRLKAISVGLEECNFLEKVWITSCPSLESLDSLQHLSHLRKLEIGGFSESLDQFPCQIEFPFQYLESLKLVGWPCLKSLPNLQHLPALRRLIIENFRMLETLPEWLGDFELLESLEFVSCFILKYLPSAEVMRSLQNLKDFSTWECPLLKERCEGSGPEWHKISHIRYIGFCDGFM